MPASQHCLARALYGNIADTPDELSLRKGDICVVLEQNPGSLEGWWLCSFRGRQGICPANRLRLIPGVFEESAPAPVGSSNKCVDPDDYDVPRPLSTTNQNSAADIIPDYDIPRSHRNSQQAISNASPMVYDVPRHPQQSTLDLDLNTALDQFERLQQSTTSAIGVLLSGATVAEVKTAAHHLNTSLQALCEFSECTLQNATANSSDKSLVGKLTPLVETLTAANQVIAAKITNDNSALEEWRSCARPLSDDIRQLASIIQGNSTLLFKESSESSKSSNSGDESTLATVDVSQMTPAEKKSIMYYSLQFMRQYKQFSCTVDAFLQTVEHNQPPKIFLTSGKSLLLATYKLISVADVLYKSVECKPIKERTQLCTNNLATTVANSVHKTKLAANQFPSVIAVQDMVDSVVEVSQLAQQLKMNLLQTASLIINAQ